MKKIILSIIILIFLTGCGFYNLDNFVLPDDEEFLEVINSLDTPRKICEYMEDNFEFRINRPLWSPYQTWLANIEGKAGDCNDYSTFAIFVAHLHGYEVYQIGIWVKEDLIIKGHALGVFVENGKYNYSNKTSYYYIQMNEFRYIVMDWYYRTRKNWISYTVYDYNMNIVEKGYRD